MSGCLFPSFASFAKIFFLLSDCSSCSFCFQQMSGGLPLQPVADANWCICSHKGCFHFIHVDTAGVHTGIYIIRGIKIWVIFTRKDGAPMGAFDMNSIHCFPNEWETDRVPQDWYNTEIILLRARDSMYVFSMALVINAVT